jgi:Uma2 family endonuclease
MKRTAPQPPGHAVRNGYPTASKKPMPETDWHRELMVMLIHTLRDFYAGQRVYVSGNLLIFYEEGDRRRHISPDVFVVRGVEGHDRPNYLIWEEGRGPEVVIELTSSSTRRADQTTKRGLYQDTLRVREYFLFDPDGDYLDPPLQGFRLRKGVYQPIHFVGRRLPSQVLGLHLERDGRTLRLWDPDMQGWLLTRDERRQQTEQRAQHAEQHAEEEAQARALAEQRAAQESQARAHAEQHAAALAEEIERLRRRLRPPATEG